jgi:hypothetical protein
VAGRCVPRGATHGPGVAGPPQLPGTARIARRGALERGGAFQPRGLFRVAMFNCDFLPILQLKCTEE